MYLYIPLDGRSLAIDNIIISSTGVQFDEPIACLDAVLGTLLRLVTDETHMKTPTEAVVEPIIPIAPMEPTVK